jgi:S1-C subfamily serine protease
LVVVAALGLLVVVAVVLTRDATPSTVSEQPRIDPQVGTTAARATVPPQTSSAQPPSDFNWEEKARSVVYIEALGGACEWSGSGSIVLDGSYILTNQHVAGDGECNLNVWLTDSTTEAPTKEVSAEIVISDSARDLAVLRMIDDLGNAFSDSSRSPLTLATSIPKLGDKLTILGYPGLGGSTITLTSGDYSGLDSSEEFDFLKTTANMNPGVSGGAALNARGEIVGIPTAGRGAEIACGNRKDCVANGSTIGLLRPASLARDIISQVSGQ